MFGDSSLFNSEFIANFAELFKIERATMISQVLIGLKVFSVVFVVFCAIDSVEGFVKCIKYRRKCLK
jgi:hypothetical protein